MLVAEFLKFCDGGEKDGVLTCEEFCEGIAADTGDMSEEDFQKIWLERMDGCISERSKDAGTLVYFKGLRSRGESCRLVAAYGGVKLEDELLTMEEWGARKSDDCPHMPYIVHPDGSGNLFETEDILRHLANLGGELVVDQKQADLAHKANTPPLFLVDPYLNLPEPMWEKFGLPKYDEWFASVPDALKDLADELGDGLFFGGEKPGYG